MRTRPFVLAALLIAGVVRAEDKKAADPGAFAKARRAAIDRGVAWLRKAQQSDGAWQYEQTPWKIGINMRFGCTGLAAYALLKCGVKPDDPAKIGRAHV